MDILSNTYIMSSVFTQIRNKQIPGIIFDDNGEFFVIHTNNPAQLGHLLVIPYQEVDNIFDLDHDTYHKLWDYVKMISQKLRRITKSHKIGIQVEGLEVPHVHVHLIPINKAGDMLGTSKDINTNSIYQLQQKFIQ